MTVQKEYYMVSRWYREELNKNQITTKEQLKIRRAKIGRGAVFVVLRPAPPKGAPSKTLSRVQFFKGTELAMLAHLEKGKGIVAK